MRRFTGDRTDGLGPGPGSEGRGGPGSPHEGLSPEIARREAAERAVEESEARYRVLLDSLHDGFAYHRIELNQDGRPVDYIFIEANEGFEKLTGLRRDAILGRRVTEVIPGIESDRFDWIGTYGKVALTGEEVRFDQYAAPLGRWYAVVASSPRRGFFTTVFADVTERKAAELALARQQRVLDAIFDNILAQVAYLDRDFTFIVANAAYAAGSGYAVEDLVGRNHFELFPNEENQRIFERVRDTGEPYVAHAKPFAFEGQPERGTTYWDWWLRPLRDPQGEIEGVVLSLVDVTETERARHEVQRLNDELRDANAAKDQFLAVLSHELRNPLSPILAGVELVRRLTQGQARIGSALDIVERSARLQARLVNDLLDLSRISRGKVDLQRAPVNLSAVVQAAVQDRQPDAEQSRVTVELDVAQGLWVEGDGDRLQQVVTNLLSNALKFTPAGGAVRVEVLSCASAADGPEPRVSGSAEPAAPASARTHRPPACAHSGVVRLTVEDTGIGIDPGLLDGLFEIFRQGELGGRKPGLGIGLALVKSLVELHGGRVWAESGGAGKGSRFSVELPRIAAPQSNGDAARGAGGASISLLLVEDNADTRYLVTESLTSMGYEVRSAASAEDALALLGGWRPDFILSDISLPGVDGYAFLARAHTLPGMAGVPAFAITGLGRDEDVRRARAAGFLGHFVKPVDVAALDRRIRDYLGSRAE